MYTVYVLKSSVASKSYVGMTKDLERRLIQHNSGRTIFSKRFLPWIVVYSKKFETREGAVKREKYLKSAIGRKFLKTLFCS